MTRASEFCYLAQINGMWLRAIGVLHHVIYTEDEHMALRITAEGRGKIAIALGQSVSFHRILVG